MVKLYFFPGKLYPRLSPTKIIKCILFLVLGDPEVNTNIYCKLRNLLNTVTQNYSTDLRYFLGHPVRYKLHIKTINKDEIERIFCISSWRGVRDLSFQK